MMKRNFIALAAVFIVMLCGVNVLFAQCGADGMQPCNPTSKKTTTTKKPAVTTKKTVSKPKMPVKTPTKTTTNTTPNEVCSEKDNFNNNNAPSNTTVTVNGVKFEFVGIPSGSFCMGSNDVETDDMPVHRVNISRPFLMGKYEVTQAQWQAIMGNNPSSFSNCGGDCPVYNVSWEDVQDFLRQLNKKGEGTFRLPTEAEWEYAARSGSTTQYSYGNDERSLGNYAWYDANSGDNIHPVGQKAPNDWGLYDMHGNVSEWCQDWYSDYRSGTVTDPTGAASGLNRVYRGGSRGDPAEELLSTIRRKHVPSLRWLVLGFRIIRN
jgi:formylglycine-generating enzyme required for sulfatase activity